MDKKQYTIDSIVGLTALRAYISNANMEVGQVTVRHMVFAELIVQVKSGKGLADAKAVFDFCFGNKGMGGKIYQSPLDKDELDESGSGLPVITISPRLAMIVYKRVKEMAMTEENVLKACEDLITCGRMYQELTIDACKKMYDVNIPYGKDMAKCHLYSRDSSDDDLNILCDWKRMNSVQPKIKGESRAAKLARANEKMNKITGSKWHQHGFVNYTLNTEPSKTTKKKINGELQNVRMVRDFMQDVRVHLAAMGSDFASDMMKVKQEFDPKWKEEIGRALADKDMKDARDLGGFMHDIYRTVNTYQTESIRKAHEKYPAESLALDEHIHSIKQDTREFIQAISNQIRIELDKKGLSEREQVMTMMDIVLSEGNNSNFAQTILPEEFFKYVLYLYQNDDSVPKYTEDHLRYCNIPEGTEVTFHAGKAKDTEGHIAYATVPLEGKFLIRKNAFDHMVASKKIEELIKMPEKKTDQVIFMTKSKQGKDKYTSAHLKEIVMKILKEEVQLAPYSRKNKNVHDSFFVDNMEIGHFRCSINEGDHSRNSHALGVMYQNKKGIADKVIASSQNEAGNIAVVILNNVKDAEDIPKDADLLKDRKRAMAKSIYLVGDDEPVAVKPKKKVSAVMSQVDSWLSGSAEI